MAHKSIRFLLNDRAVELADIKAEDTLLDFLRLDRKLTGTKEGCAEGDCGACTVLVGRLRKGRLSYDPVNSCIRFLGSLNACHVVTVEGLRAPDGGLHAVQQAMVEHHGSQCGFCTPGFVMSLYRLWMENQSPTDKQIETALQGNLCRCTGYEAIMRAARAMGKIGSPEHDALVVERKTVIRVLKHMASDKRIEIGGKNPEIIVPVDAEDFANAVSKHKKATVVAGSTDVGLWTTKHFRAIAPAIFINHLDDLAGVKKSGGKLRIGAATSYENASAELAKHFDSLGLLINRIGGAQIRAMGTIGGNIANGSPIGDMPPPLIALGAEVTLRSSKRRRTIDLEDFFVDYGKQDLKSGEFVESISVPLLKKGETFSVYKISKRLEEDITASLLAIRITIGRDGTVSDVRIACGGMAATPKRAKSVEKALHGKEWKEETVNAAMVLFEKDFAPLTDMRATADYRMLTVKNLLYRFYLESQGGAAPMSLAAYRAA